MPACRRSLGRRGCRRPRCMAGVAKRDAGVGGRPAPRRARRRGGGPRRSVRGGWKPPPGTRSHGGSTAVSAGYLPRQSTPGVAPASRPMPAPRRPPAAAPRDPPGQAPQSGTGTRAPAPGQGAGRSGGAVGPAKRSPGDRGGGRGRRIRAADRRHAVELIAEAHRAGARLARPCAERGLDVRPSPRWTPGRALQAEGRPAAGAGEHAPCRGTGGGAGALP